MQKFSFHTTEFEGVTLIKPFISEDQRGAFIKDYSREIFLDHGFEYDLKEVFYTESIKGVIRAIHFQTPTQQPKLVRCVKGAIFDVIVDLRNDSATFGQWLSFELNDQNKDELLIPAFFGHGYLVLEDSIVSYKCSEKFVGSDDDGIMWNDQELKIHWPLDKVDSVILSERDQNLQSFSEFKKKAGVR